MGDDKSAAFAVPTLDARTLARVVESVVTRGDISALTSEERGRYYVQMCESLGLSASAQPFAVLKLNGKEILYPTRGATDQLAAVHRLNRRIIDGPKIVDVAGNKLIYAVCEATHPNGRVETATAMVPLPTGAENICNAYLKTETKARRRATLSILGLGMLDETEVDLIPQSAKAPAPAIVVHAEALPPVAPGPPAFQTYRINTPTPAETPPPTGHTTITVPPAEAPPPPDPLAAFAADVLALVLPGNAVDLWRRHRAALATLGKTVSTQAWRDLVARVATVESSERKTAETWLRGAVHAKDHPPKTASFAALAPHQLTSATVAPDEVDAYADAVLVRLAGVRDGRSLDTWETALAGLSDAVRSHPAWARVDAALATQRATVGGAT